ncbi:MAG: SMR family transporter [bacterium]|nr:SMR family transporter [bacterium]
MFYVLLVIALVANALANIFLKLGMMKFSGGISGMILKPWLFVLNAYVFSGLVFFGIALVLYSLVLSKMNLSVAYPIMTGVGFVIVLSFSVLGLHEQFIWWQWIGIVLIFLGVLLLSQGTS